MALSTDAALQQIDAVLTSFDAAGESDWPSIRTATIRGRAAIERLGPRGSAYLRQTEAIDEMNAGRAASRVQAALRALRDDIDAGALRTTEELLHADVFEDFLSMAEELHSKGYEAAAAVVAGSVLEEHARKLAGKNGIVTVAANGRRKSFETLGVDLVKHQPPVISEPERKILAGWYGQRTEGAHGRPENVIADQVGAMIDGIRAFIVRHPA
jgi:hypothetical protein